MVEQTPLVKIQSGLQGDEGEKGEEKEGERKWGGGGRIKGGEEVGERRLGERMGDKEGRREIFGLRGRMMGLGSQEEEDEK